MRDFEWIEITSADALSLENRLSKSTAFAIGAEPDKRAVKRSWERYLDVKKTWIALLNAESLYIYVKTFSEAPCSQKLEYEAVRNRTVIIGVHREQSSVLLITSQVELIPHIVSQEAVKIFWLLFFLWQNSPRRAKAASFCSFLDHTVTHYSK